MTKAGDREAPGAPDATPQGLFRGLLLYIDDNEVNRILMEAFLACRPAIEVLMAADGESGLVLAQRRRPDLILLDIQLPGLDGYQVLAALRADPDLQHVPCLAVSANAMPAAIEQALTAGFDGYITKPLSLDTLLAEIDRRCRRD